MKKVLFSFAIAAVAAAFVSCGNKSAENAEGQDSAAVSEEQTEQKVEEKAPVKDYTGNVNKLWTEDEEVTLEDVCKFTLPAYHLTCAIRPDLLRANLYTPWEGDLKYPPVKNNLGNFTIQIFKLGTAEGWLKPQLEGDKTRNNTKDPLTELKPITIDGKQFKAYSRKGYATYYLRDYADGSKGYILISLFPNQDKDETLLPNHEITKGILNNIKFFK